ncbi:MAG: extracellular solute-binding protein [Oscillospiraceae bacterium]
MTGKKCTAVILALLAALSTSACGSKEEDSSEAFSGTENVSVAPTDKISAIPDGQAQEILYMGVDDLNPTRANPEKTTQLALFEAKGGSIQYTPVTYVDRFDKIAAAVMAQTGAPDIVNYEWLSFPSQVVVDMYKPIDSLVDFNDSLWSGVKKTADQFVLGGKHYVAPLSFEASAIMCYDKDRIDENSLADPYTLYQKGEWNWDNWEKIMRTYVENASGDEARYGINGFYKQHVIQQTGKTLVTYDAATNQFSANLDDPDIEKGQDLLYDMMKDGLVLNGWIGDARSAFNSGCLFYAMGDWGFSGKTNGPKDDDNWLVVPMPQYTGNPQNITTSDMKAFMWMKTSEKDAAVKCWLECCRVAATDPTYLETTKQKFMQNNPNWTDEMYDVKRAVSSDDYLMVFDYAYGLSAAMGDPKGFDGNTSLVDALYTFASSLDEDGNQPTWTQLREQYEQTVQYEVDTINKKVADYNAK